ncbi:MAG: HAD family hydrolase [Candidatus Freyarchaeota archaeon]
MKIGRGVRVVLFDLDGTLIDTRNRFYVVFNESLEKFSLPTLTRDTFDRFYRKASLGELIPENLETSFWDYFLESYSKTSSAREYRIPGSKLALYELKKMGMDVGIVTGRIADVESVWSELARHELAQFVDTVVTRSKEQNSNTDYFSKEHNLLEALESMGRSPFESIFVGDYVADIRSGKRIGAITVAVLSGGVRREILARENPDLILESVANLPPIIKDQS